MRHSSIPTHSPIEFVNMTPLDFSPLISKCQIKVCYVGDKPNRNGSVITKEVAKQMAPSIRGAMIVGHYNENTEDFEEHNTIIELSNGKVKIKADTQPYGFVDINAPVWFQKFWDDGRIEREYLVTEGYLWTGQMPEAMRVITKSNNQSMELDNDLTQGSWATIDNSNMEFYIINKAILSKLCILGDDCEPCFEGATISNTQFSFDDSPIFKEKMFSLLTDIKEILSKGGTKKMFEVYTVQIGSPIFEKAFNYLAELNSEYLLEGFFREEEQIFFVASDKSKFSRFNINIGENDIMEIVEVEADIKDIETQFSLEDINTYAESKKKPEEDKAVETEFSKNEKIVEDNIEEVIEEVVTAEEITITYSLEEIPEYNDALSQISNLNDTIANKELAYSSLETSYNELLEEVKTLREFKNKADKAEKETLINSFYMLSDEDKAEVVENIDKYSLEDIESKLSILCVRRKVSFAKEDEQKPNLTYKVEDTFDSTPDWIKAVLDTAKDLN